MNIWMIPNSIAIGILSLLVIGNAYCGDVEILSAEFHKSNDGHWSVSVTLKHADTGWDHYADNWRVVDADGNVLGNRVLHHPHVDEQPFTRSLSGVTIEEEISAVYIEAHDKQHGWTANRLKVQLPATQ
ncbi:MAG: hypothetical protein KZQ95_16980 [Candidatus Thiodiazotropha sp. (ex Epidulcina cf. delphinae)]|nr:hypothetical protein [Candidatus Thiodiazotropha sp. (ex Epidulcina cf. delphinae)]